MTAIQHSSNEAKYNMIEQQIRPWEVLDNQVLDVLNRINRSDFVADEYKGLAYADCRLPICEGCSMMPPNVEGRMLQSLKIQAGDQILEVGCGCGYITACLAALGHSVLSLERNAPALEIAKTNLHTQNITNVSLENANALTDINVQQRYDAITVNGSVDEIPENLKQALAIGGRLFVIVGHSPVMQALLLTRVSNKEWATKSLFETDLPALS